MTSDIVSFHQDDEGEWIVELSCGHRRHVRHRPPFEVRYWVLNEADRAAMVGSPLECRLCAVSEFPEPTATD